MNVALVPARFSLTHEVVAVAVAQYGKQDPDTTRSAYKPPLKAAGIRDLLGDHDQVEIYGHAPLFSPND